MGGAGVIDNFLGVFTKYIDSGFGLLSGEVAFIATTLIVIDVTLAALFWSWSADDDVMARLVKKTLFVGVFAYIIGNWNNLARIVFESFAGLGVKATGGEIEAGDLMRPGFVAGIGFEAAQPLLRKVEGRKGGREGHAARRLEEPHAARHLGEHFARAPPSASLRCAATAVRSIFAVKVPSTRASWSAASLVQTADMAL